MQWLPNQQCLHLQRIGGNSEDWNSAARSVIQAGCVGNSRVASAWVAAWVATLSRPPIALGVQLCTCQSAPNPSIPTNQPTTFCAIVCSSDANVLHCSMHAASNKMTFYTGVLHCKAPYALYVKSMLLPGSTHLPSCHKHLADQLQGLQSGPLAACIDGCQPFDCCHLAAPSC